MCMMIYCRCMLEGYCDIQQRELNCRRADTQALSDRLGVTVLFNNDESLSC